MNIGKLLTPALLTVLGLTTAASLARAADTAPTAPPAGQADIQLPPGWTEADMQACIMAGTPGPMQKHLASEVGVWHGKSKMWMTPDGEPVASECTSTVTTMMDGRYVKCEMSGMMPGMGPYTGVGLYGFDNVSQQFVSIWIDNHSTGIMAGDGELSDDGKTMTWTYTANCPITKKPTVLREVETTTGPNSKTLEMFGSDPKSGKEYKMMSIELTKK